MQKSQVQYGFLKNILYELYTTGRPVLCPSGTQRYSGTETATAVSCEAGVANLEIQILCVGII